MSSNGGKEKWGNELDDRLFNKHNLIGVPLLIAAWLTVIGVIFMISHQYWTKAYVVEVYKDTVTNIRNNYGP